jgi:hypothetical protein
MKAYCNDCAPIVSAERNRLRHQAAAIENWGDAREQVEELVQRVRATSPIGGYGRNALALLAAAHELDVSISVKIAAVLREDRARDNYRRLLRMLAESEGF